MNCGVHEADLSALLDGEVDAVLERRLRDHLAVCPTCRAAFAEVRKVSGIVRKCDLALPGRSEDFVARVVRKAAAPRPLPSLPVPSPLAAAAVLLLFLGLSFGALLPLGGSPDLPPVASGDPVPYPNLSGDPDLHPGPLAAAADPRVTPLPELGPPLPPLPPLPARTAELPTGEDLYRACGLVKSGDHWMSREAYGRFIAHREQDDAIARAEENREARRTASPPPEDLHPVAGFVTSLRPGDSVAHGALVVVPLLDGDGDAGIEVVSLEEALRERIVRVEEKRDSASLSGRNRDPKRHVFLARGEVLTGGHQDRVLTRDTLIPPGTTVTLPVTCCEQGRFLGHTDQFSKSPGLATPGLRRLLLGVADKERIWARIAADLKGLGAAGATKTAALGRIFDTGRGARALEDYAEALLPGLEGDTVVGFLAFSGGKLIGGEVFASHAVFQALAPRYLESYVLEVILAPGGPASATPPDVPELLAKLADAQFYETRAATFGRETEFEGGLSGSALLPVAGARPLHVSIFPPSEGGIRREQKAGDRPKSGSPNDSGGAPPPTNGDGGHEGEGERRIRDRQKGRQQGGGTELTPPDVPDVPGVGGGKNGGGGVRVNPPQKPGGATRPGGGSARKPGGTVRPADPDGRRILEMR